MRHLNISILISLAACLVINSNGAFAQDDPHAGHAHAAEAPQRVPVTQEQVARLGIKISRATKGTLHKEIRVPGAIKLNADALSHVVPQAAGVVRKISAALGQQVKKGQLLAVIASRDLAEAKAEYLASTERLTLVQEVYEREKRLHEKKVSSEQDYLLAKQALAEEKILSRSARQKLLTFGIAPAELTKFADAPEEDFASYRIAAPSAGTVIEKNILLGEVVNEDATLFAVADLSSVWVDLEISQDSISSVQKGQTVEVRLPDGTSSIAELVHVSPTVSEDTRTALARAIVSNDSGKFRPGTFVQASILVPSQEEAVVIPKSSVQLVQDHPCVFVWGDAAFELREITMGVSDGREVEILTGLCEGEAVASENAFHLKAEYVKSMAGDMGAHAGHSH